MAPMKKTIDYRAYGDEPTGLDYNKSNNSLIHAFNWHNYFGNHSDAKKYALKWSKDNKNKKLYEALKQIPDEYMSTTFGWLCRLESNDNIIPDGMIERGIEKILKLSKKSYTFKKDTYISKFDLFLIETKSNPNHIIEKLKIENISTRLLNQIEEKFSKNDIIVQLCNEGRDKNLKNRKPRKIKIKRPEDMKFDLDKIHYQKSLKTPQIASIDPETIISSKLLYIYDSKKEILIKVESKEGLYFKGTTLKNVDSITSKKIRTKKKMKEISMMNNMAINPANEIYDGIRSKELKATPRTNSNTLFIKSYK